MSTEPNVSVELITPAKAEQYLAKNTHNRPVRQRIVEAYARDMQNGDWLWNGEGIKFDANGTLHDGQHRLLAIVLSDKPTRMLVVRDLTTLAQDTMDGGIKRKFSDVLALRGEAHAKTLATMVRAITKWERGGISSRDGFTNAELFRTLEKYPWVREGCTTVEMVQRGSGLPGTVGGLAYWLFMQIDAEDALHFFNRLASDQDHGAGEPIYMLRKVLQESREMVRGNKNATYIAAVTIKAWNKYRDGEQVGQLKFRVGGANPERFPEPK